MAKSKYIGKKKAERRARWARRQIDKVFQARRLREHENAHREEARRVELIFAKQQRIADTLAMGVMVLEASFPEYDGADYLKAARAYMLGERHTCPHLPAMLGAAVARYRADVLARRQHENHRINTRWLMLSRAQLDEVEKAMLPIFGDLLEVSDGLRCVAEWHPACRMTNDHARSRRGNRRLTPLRWQRRVLQVYLELNGVVGADELYEFAALAEPHWLRDHKKQASKKFA